MMNKKTLIIGTSGLAKQLKYHYSQFVKHDDEIIFFDNINNIKEYDGYKVINNVNEITKDIKFFIIGLSNPKDRQSLTKMCLSERLSERNILSEDLHMPRSSQIEQNVIILRKCIIEEDVKVGYGSLINIGVNLHHGVKLGTFVTIAPNTILLGDVEIGKLTFIGAGSIVREKTKIGKNSLIGMGSNVVCNIPDNEVWYGNPAKFIRKNS